MNRLRFAPTLLFLAALALCNARLATSQSPPAAAGARTNHAAARDGQHDFDFDLGTWRTHSSRLLHPLTGSPTWVEMDGVTVVHKVWEGRANLAEFHADGPVGHIELLSLRWYNL